MKRLHAEEPWSVANQSIDKEGRQGFRIESLPAGMMVGEFIWDGPYAAAEHPDHYVEHICKCVNACKNIDPAAVQTMINALEAISMLGGNLSDDRLTSRTGPNDAVARGLKYCEARRLALEALAQAFPMETAAK